MLLHYPCCAFTAWPVICSWKKAAKMKNVMASMSRKLKRGFSSNVDGSLSTMIGLSMLTICVAIGCAIDYGRVTNAQQRLSVSMDAAVLHVANLTGKSESELKTLAYDNLMKNYGSNPYDEVSGFDLKAPTGKIQAKANVRVKTWFMSIVGYKYMDIPIAAEAVRGGKNIEVALVLDNTGSMSAAAGGGKDRITVLRESAVSFVDTVIADPADQTPYYSKAALVPFAGTVNPGALLGGARLAVNTTSGCRLWGCPTYRVTISGNNYDYVLNNCVTERMGASAFTDDSITTTKATYAYDSTFGNQDTTCINGQVRLLSSDKANLKSAINAMTANGGTAGHLGLQWGFQMLAPTSGLSVLAGDPKALPGSYSDESVKKIMIFMTDGEMTQWACNGIMRYTGWATPPGGCNNPNGDSQAQALATCSNIKARNIEMYFVGIGLDPGNSNVTALSQACSTDASHIVLATDGAALKAAFATIAANLKAMRLSM